VPHLVLHQFSQKARTSAASSSGAAHAHPPGPDKAAEQNGSAAASAVAASRAAPGSSDSLEAVDSVGNAPEFAGMLRPFTLEESLMHDRFAWPYASTCLVRSKYLHMLARMLSPGCLAHPPKRPGHSRPASLVDFVSYSTPYALMIFA
jgi:hypothetical protein